jgi:hypothetical protein
LLAEQNAMSLLHDNAWFVNLHASWGDSRNFYFAMVCPPFASWLDGAERLKLAMASDRPSQNNQPGGQTRARQSSLLHGGIGQFKPLFYLVIILTFTSHLDCSALLPPRKRNRSPRRQTCEYPYLSHGARCPRGLWLSQGFSTGALVSRAGMPALLALPSDG